VRHGFEIGERRPQQGRIVLELTDAEIASAAEQPAHLSGDVAVIDAERAGGSLLADGAGAALVLQQHVILAGRMETAIARNALSIVRVFRIAPLPGDAVPGGHWRRSP